MGAPAHDEDDSEDETVDNQPTKKVKPEEEVDNESTLEKIEKYLIEHLSFLKTREGRSAKISNFLRGLVIHKGNTKDEVADPSTKCMFVCDAGLAFNSPYPLVLRKERQADLILSFDYSARDKDFMPPFGELIKAEQWARHHNIPFPPINHAEQYKKYGLREYYVFKDDKDP